MITNHFINVTLVKIFGGDCNIKVKDTSGTERTAFGTFYNNSGTYRTSLTGGGGVVFLHGGSEPTPDDYTSDGTPVTGLEVVDLLTFNSSDDVASATVVYTITNTNDFDVTIDEVCWVVNCNINTTRYILADRTKLENPITIAAGGVGKVAYTIEANLLR